MSKTILKKIFTLSIASMAMMSFLIHFPTTSYAVEEYCTMRVEVSPYQVNIDGRGVAHDVRVLTYTYYSNTAEVSVVIDDLFSIDSQYIEKTRDSVGHLVVKIDLEALKLANLSPDNYHILTVTAQAKTVGACMAYTGDGAMYVVDKKGR